MVKKKRQLPTSQEPMYSIDRREVLRMLAGSAFMLSTGGILAGCGGGGTNGNSGGGGNVNPPAGTQTFTGTINTQEIGGSGLTVQSAYQSASPVGSSGSFTTSASNQGTQLITVSDNTGKMRALGLSNPALPSLTLGAASTAVSLIFLTPGILVTDPTQAGQAVSKIQALPSFATLASFLAQNLPTSSLNDLQTSTTLESLKAACINDLTQLQSHALQSRVGFTDTKAGFKVSLQPAPVSVSLSNAGFRFLSVVRQNLDANGVQIGTPVLLRFKDTLVGQASGGLMDGGQPVDWGSILTLTVAQSANEVDAFDFSSVPNVAALRYWFYGPGSGPGYEAPPFDQSLFGGDGCIGASLLYYGVFPLIDLVLSAFKVINKVTGANILWSAAQGALDVATLAQAFIVRDSTAIKAASVKLVQDLIAFLTSHPDIIAGIGLTGPVATSGLGILESVAFLITASNLSIVAFDYLALPGIASVEVAVSSGIVKVH